MTSFPSGIDVQREGVRTRQRRGVTFAAVSQSVFTEMQYIENSVAVDLNQNGGGAVLLNGETTVVVSFSNVTRGNEAVLSKGLAAAPQNTTVEV